MLKGSQMRVTTSIASLPDWSHSFELLFRDAKSCRAWFAYLQNYGNDDMPCEPNQEVFENPILMVIM